MITLGDFLLGNIITLVVSIIVIIISAFLIAIVESI